MNRRLIWAMTLVVTMSLIGLTPAFAKGSVMRVSLTGSSAFPAAKGTAKYKVQGAEREFQVEVENVRVLAGKTLSVLVNGKQAGSMRVNTLGEARLSLNTTNRQMVPVIKKGSLVTVKTAAGKVVVAGRFA
jgi:hypothetical protein